jgi:ElaB/YqjD/DUF883 family membrane-anchored ribosome-binding protein
MNKQTRAILHDLHQLAEDAQALIAATADSTGETAAESRKRLSTTLERGEKLYGDFSVKAFDSALSADEAVTKYVYHAIGIAAGALLGFFAAHRCISKRPNQS